MKKKAITIPISGSIGQVSGEVVTPGELRAMLVLAHGAGANMHHRFMTVLAGELAGLGIGTVRFNFPFMESGKGRPDPPAVAEKTVGVVLHKIRELFPAVPLFAGGKSFGGRMTSQYVSKEPLPFLSGLIFFGFPLHAPGKPSTERAAHLEAITMPMLFLQGTRDALANLQLIEKITSGLATATLAVFDGADHSFKAGKKELIPELSARASGWIGEMIPPAG